VVLLVYVGPTLHYFRDVSRIWQSI